MIFYIMLARKVCSDVFEGLSIGYVKMKYLCGIK